MRKRLLVKEAGLVDFFKSFFAAKAAGKDDKFISGLEKADAELAASIEKLNNTLDANMIQLYHAYRKKGLKTDKIVAYLKQHGIPIPK